MTTQAQLQKAAHAIRKADSILLASHVNPDGDTIGCMLALGSAFSRMGKKVVMLNQDGVPARFRILEGSGSVRRRYDRGADLAIAVDCGTLERLGTSAWPFKLSKQVMQIDHHDVGVPFGTIRLVDPEAAAVGEIVYELLKELKAPVTRDMAVCLLTSIIVDTCAFTTPSVQSHAFRVCGELLAKGVDFMSLVERIFWKPSVAATRLIGVCLTRARHVQKGRLVWTSAGWRDFARYGVDSSEIDGVVEELRTIEGVQVAVLFREEKNGKVRVSMRSRNSLNVARVAQAFGGGGHHDAAGCQIPAGAGSRRKLLKRLEALVKG